jgi:hypothetical protein
MLNERLRIIVSKPNRVAQICRDQEAIARNAECVRRLCRLYPDNGDEGDGVPAGATCTHPRMRCPSNCGKPCGHWFCPDCGLTWDDRAEK